MALWVGQVGTNQFRNITQGKYSILRAAINRTSGFTPDGSEVVITQGPLGQTLLTPFVGGPVRPFLKAKEGYFDWSQDGTRLVHLFTENGDPIFVAEADGANPVQIFQSRPGEHNHFPTWSPDGRWIYFVHGTVDIEEWDLWRVPAAGGQAERQTEFNRYLGFPTPLDARTVVYVGKDQDGSGPWLWTLDVVTRRARRAIPGLERYTSIASSAPGNRWIAPAGGLGRQPGSATVERPNPGQDRGRERSQTVSGSQRARAGSALRRTVAVLSVVQRRKRRALAI
jgi:Tol biopolymer transport system component